LSSRKRIINNSIQEKCYGYIFPINIISKLRKKYKGVNYNVRGKNINIVVAPTIPIGGPRAVRVSKQKENVDLLFEILTLNMQKKCPQCGKINIPDDNFCKECGIELIILSSLKKCPQCGKINLPDDNFCKECGIELKGI